MLRKAYQTLHDVLSQELGKRPKAAECALVLDPDRLLRWDRPVYEDGEGSEWHRLLFTGDDIAFRFGLRHAVSQGGRRLIVITRDDDDADGRIVITHLADVLASVEGDPIDLSLVGYFKRLFPKVSPPIEELRKHKHAFIASVAGLVGAYNQFKLRWGEPDSWNRGQLLAILLMAQYPHLSLETLWCNETDIRAFLCHAVRLLLYPGIEPEHFDLVRRIVRESSQFTDLGNAEPWLKLNPPELGAYLVLRDFLRARQASHPATLLAGKIAFSVDPHELEPMAPLVVAELSAADGIWSQVNRAAEEYLSTRNVAQVLELAVSNTEDLVDVVLDEDCCASILRDGAARLVRGIFDGSQPAQTPALFRLAEHPGQRPANDSPAANAAKCLRECLGNLVSIENTIDEPLPTFTTVEDLLAWYVSREIFGLELKLSQAFARLESVGDVSLLKAGDTYVFGEPGGLKTRLRKFLDEIDLQLADFIRPDPEQFAHSQRSTVRLLKNTVYKHRRNFDRIWILLFDGMRYDTWDVVVWPILSEHFEAVDPQPLPWLAVLPSKTDIARRSLFAGGIANSWKSYGNRWTRDERVLAARALGLLKHQCESDVRFIREAETEESRRKMGFTDAEAPAVNILIYPISDELGHHHSDSLASLNEKIRQQMVTQQGMRGILDDLRTRVGPNDLVLVTSDHGFIELPPNRKVEFKSSEAHQAGTTLEESVAYRHLKNLTLSRGKEIGPHITISWQEPGPRGKQTTEFTLPVGSVWYHREGGKPTRYHHGGVSMAEMVVPGVMLKQISQKQARIELLNIPEELKVTEGDQAVVTLCLRNTGNIDADYRLTAMTNLNETLLDVAGRLAIGKSQEVQIEFTPRCGFDANRHQVTQKTTRSIVVQLSHTDLSGQLIQDPDGKIPIRVTVKPKADKLFDEDVFQGLPD